MWMINKGLTFKQISERFGVSYHWQRLGFGFRLSLLMIGLTVALGSSFYWLGSVSASPPQDCFSSPGSCGYPDPNYNNNAGATSAGATSSCSSLTAEPSGYTASSGETIQNMNITGQLTINVPNVTVRNVCVTSSGNEGVIAVFIGSNAIGLKLENSTFAGTSETGTGVIDTGVWNASNVANVTANNIYIYNAAEDWHGTGTITDSYMQAGAFFIEQLGQSSCSINDGYVAGDNGCPSHNEDIYVNDATTGITLDHDTLLNSSSQTAVFFGDDNGGDSNGAVADNAVTISNSFLAGGGYTIYANAKASSSTGATEPITFENNRFARCAGPTFFNGFGTICTGLVPDGNGVQPDAGDGHGYYPNSGFYGLTADMFGTSDNWCGNIWDDAPSTYIDESGASGSGADSSETVACPAVASSSPTTGSDTTTNNTATAALPKAPDTGFGGSTSSPLMIVGTACFIATVLWCIARRLQPKQ